MKLLYFSYSRNLREDNLSVGNPTLNTTTIAKIFEDLENRRKTTASTKRQRSGRAKEVIGASLSEPHSYVLTWTFVIGDIY